MAGYLKKQVTYLSELGVNRVFLGGSAGSEGLVSNDYRNLLKNFILAAENKGIQVHAMTCEPSAEGFSNNPNYEDECLSLIHQVFMYNLDHPEAPFTGVHIDVEPFEEDFNRYLDLIENIRVSVDDLCDMNSVCLEFSAATQFDWDPNELAPFLHTIVPMAYDRWLGKVVDWTGDKLFLAAVVYDDIATHQTIVGLGAHHYQSLDEIQDIIQFLEFLYGDQSNYRGTSVFKYSLLRITGLFEDATSLIDSFVDDAVDNPNNKKTFQKKIAKVVDMFEEGLYTSALNKLRNDVLSKADGCAGDPEGDPDGSDWIIACEEQTELWTILGQIENLIASQK